MSLKFNLTLLLFLSIYQVSAQFNITSSTCGDSDVLGAFSQNGTINGKINYIKGHEPACNDHNTETDCINTIPRYVYTVSWNNSRWEWTKIETLLDCQWFAPAGQCIPGFDNNTVITTTLLATNTEDSAIPPCSGWVAAPGGCIPTTITNCETLSVIRNTFSNDLSLYPNPTNGKITINLRNNYSALNINLININGQVIWARDFYNSSLLKLKIDQPSGLYFLQIKGENGEKAFLKVIKE